MQTCTVAIAMLGWEVLVSLVVRKVPSVNRHASGSPCRCAVRVLTKCRVPRATLPYY